MNDDGVRLLEVISLDDLNSEWLIKIIDFFNSEFPDSNSNNMTSEFFHTKIKSDALNQTGFLTIAVHDGKVVGTCSAIKKELVAGNKVFQVVEVGDTFTSPGYRRNCQFNTFYPGTNEANDYLNLSVFGRLVSETLDRAQNSGVDFVYGVPNLLSKLPYLKRLGFELLDGNSIYRLSSPTITHPAFESKRLVSNFYKIYLESTLYVSKLVTRSYTVELKNPLLNNQFLAALSKTNDYAENLQIINSQQWLTSRFLKNTDKEYSYIQVKNKKTHEIVGCIVYLMQERTDGFRLLLHSKDLFLGKQLKKYRLAITRIAAQNLPEHSNLSVWVDLKENCKPSRFLYGFVSKPARIDIIGKNLNSSFLSLQSGVQFCNFQYGDSDLG